MKPGKRLSLQSHKYRAEHWFIVEGEVTVTLDNKEIILTTGDSIDIPMEAIHRVGNNTNEQAALIEIQTGSYLGEDDIKRYEDDFNRTPLKH